MLLAWTAVSQLAFGVAVSRLASWAALPWPVLVSALMAAAMVIAFRPLVLGAMPDRPRPWWRVTLLEMPYFTHWCASQFALVALIVALPVALATSVDASTWALAGYGAGLVLSVWGIVVRRRWVHVRRLSIVIDQLPPAFDGYRITQLSDLHVGSYVSDRLLRKWALLANATAPDLIAITGDLVSSGTDHHDRIAAFVGSLRARDAVIVTPGNHDYFGDGLPLFDQLRKAGAHVLRNECMTVARQHQHLVIGGVDDVWTGRANVARTLLSAGGRVTVLLAHDPVLFEQAAEADVPLVLSGHTHGGQFAVPFWARKASLSALSHRHWLGHYRRRNSQLVVHAGLGTTGPPIRVGVAPEIIVIELRSAGSS